MNFRNKRTDNTSHHKRFFIVKNSLREVAGKLIDLILILISKKEGGFNNGMFFWAKYKIEVCLK